MLSGDANACVWDKWWLWTWERCVSNLWIKAFYRLLNKHFQLHSNEIIQLCTFKRNSFLFTCIYGSSPAQGLFHHRMVTKRKFYWVVSGLHFHLTLSGFRTSISFWQWTCWWSGKIFGVLQRSKPVVMRHIIGMLELFLWFWGQD